MAVDNGGCSRESIPRDINRLNPAAGRIQGPFQQIHRPYYNYGLIDNIINNKYAKFEPVDKAMNMEDSK